MIRIKFSNGTLIDYVTANRCERVGDTYELFKADTVSGARLETIAVLDVADVEIPQGAVIS